MRLLIPTYGRAERISTTAVPALAGLDQYVLVHDEEEAAAYASSGRTAAATILVTDVERGPGGKTRQMEAGLAMLAEPGEWVVFADDDMERLTAVEPELYGLREVPIPHQSDPELARRFLGELDAERWQRIIEEDIREARLNRARIVGYATNPNYYFRSRKYRTVGRVAGGLNLWRYDPSYRHDDTIVYQELRDTAEHLRRYGAVLINNYVWADCAMYVAGGQGTAEQRRERREADLPRLLSEYRGLFREDRKDGYPDARVRFTSATQVERWRRGL